MNFQKRPVWKIFEAKSEWTESLHPVSWLSRRNTEESAFKTSLTGRKD
jgi:hypothetical protein